MLKEVLQLGGKGYYVESTICKEMKMREMGYNRKL